MTPASMLEADPITADVPRPRIATYRHPRRLLFSGLAAGVLAAGLRGVARSALAGPMVVGDSVDVGGTVTAVQTWSRPVLRAALFAVPVLALFGALLASADEVFSTPSKLESRSTQCPTGR